MGIKSFLSRTSRRLRVHKLYGASEYKPQMNDNGLISQDVESSEQADENSSTEGSQVVVKAIQPTGKPEPLEKLQAGFDKLVGQLQGINEHLNKQVAQQEELTNRIDKLPKLLESFPAVVENQKQITEQLFEHLKAATAKNQQFSDIVDKIPAETAKQTDILVDIDHQLAAAADTDVQIAENFNKFNETLDKLNQSTLGQTDGIMQMSKTFATSDRYLKYIISKQNKRFIWIFITALSVCTLTVLILTGIVIYLMQ